jgi:hypothetical protein
MCATHDIGTGLRTAHAIESGWIQVNQGLGQMPGHSYGGYKQRGMGREGSLEGMLDAFRGQGLALQMSIGIADRDPPFHAQCDIAAMVFGWSDNPDLVLSEFVKDLQTSGKRVAGMLQLGRQADAHRDHAIQVTLLLQKKDMTLGHRVLPQPVCCGIETQSLHDLADALTADIRSGADVVVINRFGKLEVEGGGFVEAIAAAAALDIPVIVAVPESNFRSWIAYSGGMSVKLGCNRRNIESWWSSVSAPPRDAEWYGTTVCETAK